MYKIVIYFEYKTTDGAHISQCMRKSELEANWFDMLIWQGVVVHMCYPQQLHAIVDIYKHHSQSITFDCLINIGLI